MNTQQKQTTSATSRTDWVILPFENAWLFAGARGLLYDSRRTWRELKLEVSLDGDEWTQVFYSDEWKMASSAAAGYMAFGTGDGSASLAYGKYVRMSWLTAPTITPGDYESVEMRDLELFVIPEPTSIGLMALGAALSMRRRRNHSR